MNGAHWHLLVNHIPVFGVAFGTLALIWSMIRNSVEMRWASVGLFVMAGISGWISSETGDAAEELVEHLPGVVESMIHEHEKAADFALITVAILAGFSILMILVERYRKQFFKAVQFVLLLLAFFSNAVMARTAYLGGQIRHTEIRTSIAGGQIPAEQNQLENEKAEKEERSEKGEKKESNEKNEKSEKSEKSEKGEKDDD